VAPFTPAVLKAIEKFECYAEALSGLV